MMHWLGCLSTIPLALTWFDWVGVGFGVWNGSSGVCGVGRTVGVLREWECVFPRWDRSRGGMRECVAVGDGSLFENCIVDASICGQVVKGARWMPWYQEPMKDVGGRDRPRGVVNRAVIRGCPNGETRQSLWAVTYA
jgi:hypothetical protein